MITIGVTAAGGGVAQAVMRALGYGNLQTRVVAMDVQPMSAGLYWADLACLVPPAADEETYIKRLLEICTREFVDVLIPGLDLELGALARHQERFLDQGCKVIVSAPDVIKLCRDKHALYQFFRRWRLPFITTHTLAEAQRLVDQLAFPVLVKPRGGSASVGARLICGADDLLGIPPDNDLIVQVYLSPSDSQDDLSCTWDGSLHQFNEVSAQFFVGPSGQVLGSFVSVNRLKDGVPIEVVPCSDSRAIREGQRLVAALAAEGLRGPVNLQGRLTSEGVSFWEANPRFTGITGVRAALGYREVEAAIWAFVLGQEQEARRCLAYSADSVALRFVDETIVSSKRIAQVRKQRSLAVDGLPRAPARVLVTGASGYVGANLIRALLDLPELEEVTAAVGSETAATRLQAAFGDSRLRFVYGELPSSPWPLEGVQVVVHLAAVRPRFLRPGSTEQFFLVNAEGTRRLLQAARDARVSRLIYLSSQAVYGTRRPPLWFEAQAAQPETPYGLSKWIGELLSLHGGAVTLPTVVLRAAQVYGWGHSVRWGDMPHKFALLAARGQSLPLYCAGEQRVDLIHVRDLCAAILRACVLPLGVAQRVVFNVGSGQPVSVAELASMCSPVAVELGLPAPAIEQVHDAAGAVCHFGMDIRRAKAQLGWAPCVCLKDGLRELVEGASLHPDIKEEWENG